ncbi:unnamed protein product [Lactuca saligna]|uniref:Uncharacterized protein n=1 Tax=Lactuca saligna TaxID=75948 RepID=A0AA36A2Y3_LACSI|nr:unnamed protein product [Lactuca saligna]
MENIHDFDTIDMELDVYFKKKPVSQCKYEFLNIQCEEDDGKAVDDALTKNNIQARNDAQTGINKEDSDEDYLEGSNKEDSDEELEYSTHNPKGLVEASKDIRPYVEHMQCARHIYANFIKVYSGVELRNMFWVTIQSTTEGYFKFNMERIRAISFGAYDHLIAREPTSWCRAYFSTGLALRL